MHTLKEDDKEVHQYHAMNNTSATSKPTCTNPEAKAHNSNPSIRLGVLKLPGELRNAIYDLIAQDQDTIRLSDDQIVLPPLGCTYKQTRAELRGTFERIVLPNTALTIEARIADMSYAALFGWLEANVRRSFGSGRRGLRTLRTFKVSSKRVRVHLFMDVIGP